MGHFSLLWFHLKILFVMFSSVRHYKFINLSVIHHTVCLLNNFLSFFIYWILCDISQTNL
jgi:hypothetical protein